MNSVYHEARLKKQRYRSFLSSEKGGALVIVLVISSLLLLSSLWAISTYRQGVNATSALLEKLDARLRAESTFQSLLYFGATGRFTGSSLMNSLPEEVGFPEKITLGGQKSQIQPANGTENIFLSCYDSSGLLNALYLDPRLFAKILRYAGMSAEDTVVVTDSLKDWTDSDDFHQLNGAEKWYYRQDRGFAYGPRNSPAIQSPWEFLLLRGMTPEVMEMLLPSLALTPTGGYNVQTMSSLMLAVRFNISLEQARQLVALREQHGYLNMTDIQSITGRTNSFAGSESSAFTSRLLRVRLEVKVGDAVERWQGWIDFVPDVQGPYRVASWQEGMGV